MSKVKGLDNELYKSMYGSPRVGDSKEIWNEIKSDPDVLRESVQITKDKFGERDTVEGLAICNAMLIDYENIDEVAYKKLIDSIYSNTDIARIVLEGASNGGYSFLLMSLWNPNLKLTEEQKTFAVNEAMNKIGTTRWQESENDFSRELDAKGISDDDTTSIDIDGSINPIGSKTKAQYMNHMFKSLSQTQAHGTGSFDIRYYILRNPNWSLEEKKKLVMDFWCSDESYDDCLEQWEWSIIDAASYFKNELNNSFISPLSYHYLYDYTYEMLLELYKNKQVVDKIWKEIQFCKQMHQLRPQLWEQKPKQLIPTKKDNN